MINVNNELLKPCPFCGKNVELRIAPTFGSDNPTEYCRIWCSCKLGSPDALYHSSKKNDMINDFNTRAQKMPELIEEIETIECALDYVIEWTVSMGFECKCKHAKQAIDRIKQAIKP
jgi:hypothetical protein